ncbi:hypothetical protein DFJ73DRAFT_812464 [Zopfochytrium polystomum]|nr:hypothetical protein DFJ73DRAFT_812464 [Zopfochytrium polystomum]
MEDIQRKSINQSVLQRHDPAVTDIIDTASYVVVYNYDLDKQSWVGSTRDGHDAPFFSFMILNRLSLDTFTFGLFPSMEYQTMENYLIYKTPEGLVQGLWMFSLDDRDRFVQLLGE